MGSGCGVTSSGTLTTADTGCLNETCLSFCVAGAVFAADRYLGPRIVAKSRLSEFGIGTLRSVNKLVGKMTGVVLVACLLLLDVLVGMCVFPTKA